jgi:predicted ABC-type ATPase
LKKPKPLKYTRAGEDRSQELCNVILSRMDRSNPAIMNGVRRVMHQSLGYPLTKIEKIFGKVVQKFNPSHDEKGRFTSVDSATTASVSDKNKKATQANVMSRFSADDKLALIAIEAQIKEGKPTDKDPSLHNADGTWNAERTALHDQILGNMKADMDNYKSDDPTMVLLGGRGGSGKSAFTNGTVNEFDSSKFYALDPDKIQGFLPGYNGMNAANFHTEAGDLADTLAAYAADNKINIVLDRTLRSVDKAADLVNGYVSKGFQVEGHYMYLPAKEAAYRAVKRALGPSHRYVPLDVVIGNTNNEAAFNRLKKNFTKWSFYSNDVPKGNSPRLVSRSK